MAENYFAERMNNKKVSNREALFVYVEWEEHNSPQSNKEINDLIVELDLDHSTSKKLNILGSLPFLTFYQAEILFRKLRDEYGGFTFQGISLASQFNKRGRLTGKARLVNQPRIVPFYITPEYDELVTPFVESIFQDKRFQSNTYDQIVSYLQDSEYSLIKVYGNSLNLSAAQRPYIPPFEYIPGALPRKTGNGIGILSNEEGEAVDNNNQANAKYEYSLKQLNDKLKRFVIVFGIGLLFAFGALCGVLSTFPKINKLNNEVYQLQTDNKKVLDLQRKEHKADNFGRFFLANYYSGVKENMNSYLATGDTKFTQPAKGKMVSVLLDDLSQASITGNGKATYSLTYLVSVQSEDGSISNKRVTFSAKEARNAKHKWLVISEPISEEYTQ